MTAVALAAIAALAITTVAWAGVGRWLIRQAARERELLLNQIMHLSGKTWTPPPAETWEQPTEVLDPGRYISSSSQIPEDF